MTKKTSLIERAIGANQLTFKLAGVPVHDELGACYLAEFHRLVKAHGKREAVKQLKAIYNEAIRLSCGLDFQPSTPIWVKRDKDLFPIKFKPFRKYLAGTTLQRRYALSILRAYESVKLPPLPNLETVTSPSKGKCAFDRIRPSFENFLNKSLFGRTIKKIFEEKVDQNVKTKTGIPFHYSNKRGVDGPTILTAGKQSLAINEELSGILKDFNSIFRKGDWISILKENQEYFKDHDDIYHSKKDLNQQYLGRLSFIPDKGGKTRLIAIGNYWVQDNLKQLHDVLYNTLRKVETDGTYDQIRQADRVQAQSAKGAIWSYDLTAATDRFPIQPQVSVLKFLSPKIGSLWESILERMEFYYEGQVYKYAVGQPMGLYSSWAVFALTHHFIIQYCAWMEREKFPFNSYAILGDDVAIWSKGVAQRYRTLLDDLDVQISIPKSFFPKEGDDLNKPCVAEFAKRIFDKGEEVSPISPGIQVDSWKSFWDIPEFIKYLEDHNLLRETVPISRVSKLLGLKTKESEYLCLLFRLKQILGTQLRVNLDICNSELLEKVTSEDVIRSRCSLLAEQLADLWGQLFDLEGELGVALEKRLVGPIPDNLYFRRVFSTRVEKLIDLENKLAQFLPKEEYDVYFEEDLPVSDEEPGKLPELSDIEYLPKIDLDEMIKGVNPQLRHRVFRGRYIRQLMKQLKTNQHPSS